jgi:hypothetical protein
MPVEFLTDDQAEAYGKFVDEPTRPELERFFFLDDVDRDLIALRRTQYHQLGFALEMCTVRYIGRFLPDDPLGVPWPVVEHLAEQLGIEDVAVVKRYTERPKTAYEHAWEIRDAYEYHDYDDPEWGRKFRTFLHGRAWTAHSEGPKALFDYAVGWLRKHRSVELAVVPVRGESAAGVTAGISADEPPVSNGDARPRCHALDEVSSATAVHRRGREPKHADGVAVRLPVHDRIPATDQPEADLVCAGTAPNHTIVADARSADPVVAGTAFDTPPTRKGAVSYADPVVTGTAQEDSPDDAEERERKGFDDVVAVTAIHRSTEASNIGEPDDVIATETVDGIHVLQRQAHADDDVVVRGAVDDTIDDDGRSTIDGAHLDSLSGRCQGQRGGAAGGQESRGEQCAAASGGSHDGWFHAGSGASAPGTAQPLTPARNGWCGEAGVR